MILFWETTYRIFQTRRFRRRDSGTGSNPGHALELENAVRTRKSLSEPGGCFWILGLPRTWRSRKDLRSSGNPEILRSCRDTEVVGEPEGFSLHPEIILGPEETVLRLLRQDYYRYLFGSRILALGRWPLSSSYAALCFCRKPLSDLGWRWCGCRDPSARLYSFPRTFHMWYSRDPDAPEGLGSYFVVVGPGDILLSSGRISFSKYRTRGVIQVSPSSMAETSSCCDSSRVAGHWSTSRGMLIWLVVSMADPRFSRVSACEARTFSCSLALKLISSVPRSRRFGLAASRPCLAFLVLFFAAAWLMLQIFEPHDMTWIIRSCRGGEAGTTSVGFTDVSLFRWSWPSRKGIPGGILS
ncbi:hypothetical protein DY000_02007353 [Brassica cretica]|uniref:Uncharacterized protein n=1 Tax=Brassica cretica TaxID=69181 RepID=A0ABQ7CAY4_BRACR|nr:hypothetical protein DY000_02007353 [Brassica cretica]